MIDDHLYDLTAAVCCDYKTLQSVCSLGNQFLYVTNDIRVVEFNFSTSTYRIVANPNDECAKNSLRFDVKTPRGTEAYSQSVQTIFPDCPLEIPLVRIYLDYDVHLIKALVSNIILVICWVADGILKSKSLSKGAVVDAFSALDREYCIITIELCIHPLIFTSL
jgi:hypothetical protein